MPWSRQEPALLTLMMLELGSAVANQPAQLMLMMLGLGGTVAQPRKRPELLMLMMLAFRLGLSNRPSEADAHDARNARVAGARHWQEPIARVRSV